MEGSDNMFTGPEPILDKFL